MLRKLIFGVVNWKFMSNIFPESKSVYCIVWSWLAYSKFPHISCDRNILEVAIKNIEIDRILNYNNFLTRLAPWLEFPSNFVVPSHSLWIPKQYITKNMWLIWYAIYLLHCALFNLRKSSLNVSRAFPPTGAPTTWPGGQPRTGYYLSNT